MKLCETKSPYESAELEVIKLSSEDIISTSGQLGGDGWSSVDSGGWT